MTTVNRPSASPQDKSADRSKSRQRMERIKRIVVEESQKLSTKNFQEKRCI